MFQRTHVRVTQSVISKDQYHVYIYHQCKEHEDQDKFNLIDFLALLINILSGCATVIVDYMHKIYRSSLLSLHDFEVDSTWDDWTDWGECSVTCGSGSKERTRTCLAPQHGGQETECSASSAHEVDSEPCKTNAICPCESLYLHCLKTAPVPFFYFFFRRHCLDSAREG